MIDIAIIIVAAAFYFTPCAIALARDHHHAVPILGLNVLCVFFPLLWIAALVWSLMPVEHD